MKIIQSMLHRDIKRSEIVRGKSRESKAPGDFFLKLGKSIGEINEKSGKKS